MVRSFSKLVGDILTLDIFGDRLRRKCMRPFEALYHDLPQGTGHAELVILHSTWNIVLAVRICERIMSGTNKGRCLYERAELAKEAPCVTNIGGRC